jgi:hypothetical protein
MLFISSVRFYVELPGSNLHNDESTFLGLTVGQIAGATSDAWSVSVRRGSFSAHCSATPGTSAMRSQAAVNAGAFNFSDWASAFAPVADEKLHRI